MKFFRVCIVFFIVLGLASMCINPKAEAEEEINVTFSEVYHSDKYGFALPVTQKLQAVAPANEFFDDPNMQGEVLVFASDGKSAKHAWVILIDAFDDKYIPDLNKLEGEEAKTLLNKLRILHHYEIAALVNVADGNKGIYAVTAKELEMDTDGDGKPDTFATADTQIAYTFFRGKNGRRYAVELIESPELNREHVAAYQMAVATFTEM